MKLVIASMNFAPGHATNLCAYYKLCVECGFQTTLYLNKEYLKYIDTNKYTVVTDLKSVVSINPNAVLLYNVATTAIKFARFCKFNGWKFFYILHEPYSGLKQLLKEGGYIPRLIGAHCVNFYICSQADKVLLASDYAMENCHRYAHDVYKKAVRFSLIFMDEAHTEETTSRKYFSHVGSFYKSHASLEFLEFVKSAVGKSILFQIATRSDITKYLHDPILQYMQKSGQLIIQQGRPLTTKEINAAYRNSISKVRIMV